MEGINPALESAMLVFARALQETIEKEIEAKFKPKEEVEQITRDEVEKWISDEIDNILMIESKTLSKTTYQYQST